MAGSPKHLGNARPRNSAKAHRACRRGDEVRLRVKQFFAGGRAMMVMAALVLAPLGAEAAYPERNITMICASGAGGIVDVTTRIIADHMSKTLGRTVVVQNEPGAGSTLAIGTVAKAAPDGYTVLTIGPGVGVVAELYPKSGVDVVRDLQPVSIMGVAPMVLLAHKSVPA